MQQKERRNSTTGHVPVLLHEAIDALSISHDDIVLDATLGGAGHAGQIVSQLGSKGTLIGIDADRAAIERAKEALKGAKPKTHLVYDNFRNISKVLHGLSISKIDKALFDLGWSSYQLASGRGFSFQKDEPLLMTYTDSPDEDTLTAKLILNTWEEESIADIIWGWGEERFSRRIAKRIVEARKERPFETTFDLVDTVKDAVPKWYAHKRTHPATKTFQALRIAVNDEIGALKEGITSAMEHMDSGGRIVVITFHSIEDRAVKLLFRGWKEEGLGSASKAIKPSREEVEINPRARSAKLRFFSTK